MLKALQTPAAVGPTPRAHRVCRALPTLMASAVQITTMPQVLSAEHSAIIKQTVGIKRCAHRDRKHTAGANLTNTLLMTSAGLVLSVPKRAMRVWVQTAAGYCVHQTRHGHWGCYIHQLGHCVYCKYPT